MNAMCCVALRRDEWTARRKSREGSTGPEAPKRNKARLTQEAAKRLCKISKLKATNHKKLYVDLGRNSLHSGCRIVSLVYSYIIFLVFGPDS